MYYCLFEQSGRFKNALRARGESAIDIDISNGFGETDIIIDLLQELENPFESDLLNRITKEDFIIAFFPCTYFCNYNLMYINGNAKNLRNMTEEQKHNYITNRMEARVYYFECFKNLFEFCREKRIPLIVENPKSVFLRDNFRAPDVSHKRSAYGDKFDKPTNYYCENCRIDEGKMKRFPKRKTRSNYNTTLYYLHGIEKSLMAETYVNNFLNAIERINENGLD